MFNSKESKTYDIAKIISVILVVVAHSTRMYTGYGAFTPLNGSRFLSLLTEYIYKFHMPLFILISGAVFGLCIDNGKYTNVVRFIINKAKRLLIPYYFFGIIYVAPVMCALGLTDQGFVEYFVKGIVLSLDSRHLWYLLALFFIFILGIILKPLLNKSRKMRIFVLVCSCALFIISSKIPVVFQLSATFKYQFYFFVGVCLHYEYGIFEKIVKKFYYLFLLLPFVLVGMFFFNPNIVTNMCYIFIGIVMIMAGAVYVGNKFERFTNNRVYNVIHKNSFGIYLFHPMIIYILYYCFGGMDIDPYGLCFGIAFASLIISSIATKLMRVLKLYVFIGESK